MSDSLQIETLHPSLNFTIHLYTFTHSPKQKTSFRNWEGGLNKANLGRKQMKQVLISSIQSNDHVYKMSEQVQDSHGQTWFP